MERLPVPKLAVKIVKVIYFFMKNVYDFYCLTYTDIMLLSTWLRPHSTLLLHKRSVGSRAGKKPLRSFHNHGKRPNHGLLLAPNYRFHI